MPQKKLFKTSELEFADSAPEKTVFKTSELEFADDPKPKDDRVQTFTEQAGQSVSLGYLPKISAAVTKGISKLGFLDPAVAAEIDKQSVSDLERARLSEMEMRAKENPGSALAGGVAGGLLLPGGAAKSGLSVGARALRAAGQGAAVGALSSQGPLEEGEDALQLNKRLGAGLLGGAFGGALSGLTSGASAMAKTIGKLPSKSADLGADIATTKALGMNLKNVKLMEKMGPEKARKFGRWVGDNLLSAGDTVDDIAEKAAQVKQQYGQKIGAVVAEFDDLVSNPGRLSNLSKEKQKLVAQAIPDGGRIAEKIEADIIDPLRKGPPADQKLASKLMADVDYIRSKGQMSFDDMQTLKNAFNPQGKFSALDPSIPQIQYRKIRSIINESAEDSLDKIGKVFGKDGSKEFVDAKEGYGFAARALESAQDRAARDKANTPFGLLGHIGGAATAGGMLASGQEPSDAAMAGLGIAGATRLARRYGPSIAAKGLLKLGKLKDPMIPNSINKTGMSIENYIQSKTGLLGGIGAAEAIR